MLRRCWRCSLALESSASCAGLPSRSTRNSSQEVSFSCERDVICPSFRLVGCTGPGKLCLRCPCSQRRCQDLSWRRSPSERGTWCLKQGVAWLRDLMRTTTLAKAGRKEVATWQGFVGVRNAPVSACPHLRQAETARTPRGFLVAQAYKAGGFQGFSWAPGLGDVRGRKGIVSDVLRAFVRVVS